MWFGNVVVLFCRSGTRLKTVMDQELHDFLLHVEDAIIGIQQAADTCLDDVDAVEGILVHAELLLRDVVLVEGIVQP